MFEQFLVHHLLLRIVHLIHRLDYLHAVSSLLSGADKSLHVFRQAGTTVSASGIEVTVAYARVSTYSFAHHVDVGTHQLTEVGDVVHERDAVGKHGVGGIFNHLSRSLVGEDERESFVGEGLIELTHQFLSLVASHSCHNTVRLKEVSHSRTLSHE